MIHQTQLEVLIATSNPGKIREIREWFRGLPLKLRYLEEFPAIPPFAEVGHTYRENAILKASGYSKHAGVYALADDSGLEVDALGGMPGVLSARYGGNDSSDQERVEKLLTALSPHRGQLRSARFICCLAVAGWHLEESRAQSDASRVLHVSEGKCEGLINEEPRGKNGFGYDPVFVPTGHDRTFAELPVEIKNVISHRAQALAAMREFLKSLTSLKLDR